MFNTMDYGFCKVASNRSSVAKEMSIESKLMAENDGVSLAAVPFVRCGVEQTCPNTALSIIMNTKH